MEKLYVKNNGKGWFACCGGKSKDGVESCAFMNVGFKKDQEPNKNPALIEIDNAFHTSYKTKSGESVLKYMILNYHYVEPKNEPKQEQETLDSTMWGGQTPSFNGVEPEDLPFY